MPKRTESTGFAARLKELRERAGLSQDELADRADLYKFSVAKLEQGVREPTWATVLNLAHALGVSVEAFVTESMESRKGDAQPLKPARGKAAGPAADLPEPQHKSHARKARK